MSDTMKSPTHFRLLSSLRSIGPYLREPQCVDGAYLFDCLSVCVNDKKSPEKREFWGWWLELQKQGTCYQARYRTGLYDTTGDWRDETLPKNVIEDVNRTQEAFHTKLVETMQSEFEIQIELHEESVEFV